MFRDVDVNFLHYLDGERVDVAGGFGSSTLDVKEISCGFAKDSFGEVAAAGVPGAEDEDNWLRHVSERFLTD